ncbi:MAG: hypothetical protein QOF97_82 [Acidimicrobiaceae bacterium]
MTRILVHGVPETEEIWEPLVSHLSDGDVVTLSLPGFGRPRPDGFGATKEDYVEWLVGELEAMQGSGPIDLVGHDWGGGLVLRLVSTRPELVRSWVTDAAGLGDIDFEWHDFAKIWQTPVEGEAFFEQQLTQSDEERGSVFELFGVPHDRAVKLGSHLDETMVGCILALYRSAMDVGREWSKDFHDVPAPGLVVVPTDDPFLEGARAQAGAQRAGAGIAELAGVGHWWMLQDPEQGAAMLETFWSSL